MAESQQSITEKWDHRHSEAEDSGEPAVVLTENIHLLTPGGKALDLACGRGASALLMVKAGLTVTAWDLSPVAIDRLRTGAVAAGMEITAEVRDIVAHPPVLHLLT